MTTFNSINVKIDGKIRTLRVEEGTYPCGQKGIQLITYEEGYPEPWGTLTVALPEMQLEDDEILVKTWSENEGWAEKAAAALGYQFTGMTVATGWVEAQIWKKQ